MLMPTISPGCNQGSTSKCWQKSVRKYWQRSSNFGKEEKKVTPPARVLLRQSSQLPTWSSPLFVRPAMNMNIRNILIQTLLGKFVWFVAVFSYWFVFNVCTIFVQLNTISVNSVNIWLADFDRAWQAQLENDQSLENYIWVICAQISLSNLHKYHWAIYTNIFEQFTQIYLSNLQNHPNSCHLIFCNTKVLASIMIFSCRDGQSACDFSIPTLVNHIFPENWLFVFPENNLSCISWE